MLAFCWWIIDLNVVARFKIQKLLHKRSQSQVSVQVEEHLGYNDDGDGNGEGDNDGNKDDRKMRGI